MLRRRQITWHDIAWPAFSWIRCHITRIRLPATRYWAGLPVLTQIGRTFAGRVAASLLNALGLTELVTHSPDEYERTAIDLATNPARLALIKDKLARNRLGAPLFNTKTFTRHIEAAYAAMHARFQAGLPPDHIHIART